MKAGLAAAPALAFAMACVLGLMPGLAAPVGAQQLPAERQTRHALIIGIGEYADPGVPALRGIVHGLAGGPPGTETLLVMAADSASGPLTSAPRRFAVSACGHGDDRGRGHCA